MRLILHISRRSARDYAWRANLLVAKAVGVKNDHLEATQNGAASCFAPAEITAFHFAVGALDLVEVTDTTFAQAKRFFSDRAIAEMLYVVGACMFVARIARTAPVPAGKIDPESALASAARMMANHRLAAPACRILEPAVASERMTITHYSSRQ